VEIGSHTKLSWLWPNTLPFFSATPTTRSGWLSTRISLPIGSMLPKKASTRSVPITATWRASSMSSWIRWRPVSSSRTAPMRGTFSVMPMTRTFSWVVRPHLAVRAVASCPPTSRQASQPFLIASRSWSVMSFLLLNSMNC